jgi:hypothetical protein
MKLAVVRRIAKEDLQRSGEVPEWVDGILGPLNGFIDQIVTILRNRITFSDNMLGKKVEIQFTHGVAKEVSVPTNSRVIGISPIDAENDQIIGYGFTRPSSGLIGITIRLQSGGSAKCTVLIHME